MTAERALPELSGPVEDYLKAIYELELRGGVAGTNEIAAALRIAAPSVSGMIRRLSSQGLVTHEPYKGVQLTREGRRAALRTIRRHRVIEAYLTQALGYPWDRVHDEAERLEHAASDELIDRMAAAIGEPETDPHGAPIPSREGTLGNEPELSALAELADGAQARISRVGDRDAERLRYLANLGMAIGAEVELVSREPYDGPITVKIDGKRRVIGPELARHILVETKKRGGKRS
ncbi:MAG TPA: metal-dependent transcriptional regulator [Gemmatimonadaceae bacterium]|nr:metal-dependent transcriptional regulator [Gemmatimonadaceae bacterium]